MMTILKMVCLARGLRRLVRVLLLVLIPGQLLTGCVCGTEDVADPYDVLYDVIMVRKDGKTKTENETGPMILNLSEFPFDDGTYDRLNAALDGFAALPQERIEAYSDIKRALMQRHLWKVFDAADPVFWKHPHTGKVKWRSRKNRRVASNPRSRR